MSRLRVETDGASIDIEQWFPLVRWVMVRLPQHVYQRLDRDDIYQSGVIGLMNAKRLYRLDGGASFKTFAVSKIRWNIYIAAGLTRKGWEPLPVQFDGDFEHELGRRSA
jgi:DNA-directed RNA polymerase specialized sigma subunit